MKVLRYTTITLLSPLILGMMFVCYLCDVLFWAVSGNWLGIWQEIRKARP